MAKEPVRRAIHFGSGEEGQEMLRKLDAIVLHREYERQREQSSTERYNRTTWIVGHIEEDYANLPKKWRNA